MGLCVRVRDGCACSASALQFIRLFNQEGKIETVVVATESSKTNMRESRIISVVALRLLNPAQVLHSFCALSPTAWKLLHNEGTTTQSGRSVRTTRLNVSPAPRGERSGSDVRRILILISSAFISSRQSRFSLVTGGDRMDQSRWGWAEWLIVFLMAANSLTWDDVSQGSLSGVPTENTAVMGVVWLTSTSQIVALSTV